MRFLKNNVDWAGNSYGCHENYECLDEPTRGRRLVRLAGFVLFWTAFLPFFLLPRVISLLAVAVFLVLILGYFLLHLLEKLPVAGLAFGWTTRRIDRFVAERGARLDEDVLRTLSRFFEWLYWPFVHVYSAFCNRFLFRPYVDGLTAHLVTRIVFCGTGRLDLAGSPSGFRLSQRASAIDSVQRIFWNEATKPLYDVKNVLIEPFSVFARTRRLHLLAGDSNLSELAEVLKVGTTALLVDRIERDGAEGLPVLARPLEALDAISADPTLEARVDLADGRSLTALEIQREYLAAVRRSLAETGVTPIWAHDVLAAWADVLGRLESRTDATDVVEWATKKSLLDRAIWGRASWTDLVRWGPALEEVAAAARASGSSWTSGAEMLAALPGGDADSLGRRGFERSALADRLDLYLTLRRIDLQFHELDPDAGSWMLLEREGLVGRSLDPERVARAFRNPPSETRARARGAFVRLANERRLVATAGWDRLRVQHPRITVRLADPRGNPSQPLEDLLGLRPREP